MIKTLRLQSAFARGLLPLSQKGYCPEGTCANNYCGEIDAFYLIGHIL